MKFLAYLSVILLNVFAYNGIDISAMMIGFAIGGLFTMGVSDCAAIYLAKKLRDKAIKEQG